MGKAVSVAIPGVECWFNSHDHPPPHFHVGKSGEWEVRVFFLTCTERRLDYEVVWGARPGRPRRRAILAAVLRAREQLMDEWEEKVCL